MSSVALPLPDVGSNPLQSPSPPLPDEIPASISVALEHAKVAHPDWAQYTSREALRQQIVADDEEIYPTLASGDANLADLEVKVDQEGKTATTEEVDIEKGIVNKSSTAISPLRRGLSFLSSFENHRTVVAWKNLTVKAKSKTTGVENAVLDNISGCITSGLWAVMGPSGCGKSTLLNALACRLEASMHVIGEMRLNGRPYSSTELKNISGYVMQDDLLNPHLTVRETLHYTAALRLPRSMTPKQREERVDEVIREMGLTHCQDVVVGDPSKKGVSGGERRRVCIGMELLTRPALLFMDEPTSGLDSVTALALGRLLQRLSRTRRCSIVVSIHQPQARLFALFDRLVLMKSGHILFQGSIPGCLQLFEECGFPVPYYVNPADHVLEIITAPLPGASGIAPTETIPLTDDHIPGQENGLVSMVARRTYEGRGYGKKGQAPLRLELELAELRPSEKIASPQTAVDDDKQLGQALKLRQRKTLDHVSALEETAKTFPDPRSYALSQKDDHDGSNTPLQYANEISKSMMYDERNKAVLLKKYHERAPTVDLTYGLSKPALYSSDDQTPSWTQQFLILLERNLYEQWRQRKKLFIAFIQQIIMGVLIGTVFPFIGTGQTSVLRRQPVLQFVCINQGAFGAMSLVNAFPGERHLMLRERASGSYHASAYFLAKTSIDSIIQLPNIVAFSLTTYYLVGFQDVSSKFVVYLLFMILCNYAATSLALMIATLCKTTDLATVALSLTLEICRLFGGFFLAPINLPKYFSWLDALSYIKYAYVGISLNENDGLILTCKPSELKNGICPYPDGETKNRELGFHFITMTGCALVLVAYIIFVRFVAYFGLRFIKTN